MTEEEAHDVRNATTKIAGILKKAENKMLTKKDLVNGHTCLKKIEHHLRSIIEQRGNDNA